MKLIRVKPRLKPNLPDYRIAKKFRWKDYYKEVDFFSGRLNAAYNAVDRHDVPNKVALYWEDEKGSREFTFREIKNLSNRFANVLKKLGVKKGDRVFIFLPRVPELYISFLGILKTGAIAGTLFAAFGPRALKDRLGNSSAKVLITNASLKKRVSEIRKELPDLKKIIVIDRPGKGDVSYKKEMSKASRSFKVKMLKPDEPAFMLYTSGTTGKPKGVIHCHKAIVQQHLTAKWVLDLKPKDIYWCTADPGWVTGIAYGILGSWSNKASSVVYAGRFDPEKWYSLIEKYQVSVFYTAPTAIRMLMKAGKAYKKYNMSSLRHMCSVGEPLNPEPIYWSLKAFGLPFHDNWWQTEAGGVLIANYPCMPIKPGSMGKPFPGIEAAIVDNKGNKLRANKEGNLAIKPGWPSMMLKIWKNREKYRSYFKKGWYISGDKAFVDKDGYYWFIGRADDVIKTGGERVGPFEVESALIEHKAIIEAAVIGKPDPLRGEIIKAFLILAKGYKPSKKLEEEIKVFIKKRFAGHAYPREIEFVNSLPKTQSGKIVRRLLKARELGLPTGDVSTIEKY